MNKLNQFQSVIYSKDLDVICITETWLNDTISSTEILPTSYTIYRNDRINRGEGVLIAVKESIPSQICFTSDTIEMITVNMNISPKLTLACLYIPPNCSTEYQRETLNSLSNLQSNSNAVILGDFNALDIDWHTHTAGTPFSRDLCNTLHQLNYIQLVSVPTHQAGNTLDLVLTNVPQRIENIRVETNSPLTSDHYPVSLDISSAYNTRSSGTGSSTLNTLNYRKANLPALAEHLCNSLETLVPHSTSLEIFWSDLKNAITQSSLRFVPKAAMPTKQSPPWFNSHIRHQLNKVRSLRRRMNRHPTPMLAMRLSEMESDVCSIIQSAKENYIAQLTTTFQSNPKKLYSYLNSLTKSKFESHRIQQDNRTIHDPYQRAIIFNEYFNSTFTTSDFTLPPNHLFPMPSTYLSEAYITEAEVYEILANLDPTKAMGCDKIHPIVLKHCSDFLASPLALLFNLSLSTGCIPTEWKIHRIRPIHKGGDQQNVANYRPISLLSITSKVLEKAIFNKVITFVRAKLSRAQFGFLRGRSCLSQLLTSLTRIFNDLDRGAVAVDAIFLDLRKAFDSVPHTELLLKLWRIGITGKLWSWFREYLSQRQHYVHIDNTSSPLLPVKSGVPQGSILGPLLFLIYINDLPECINYASCYLFADDSKVFKSIFTTNDCSQLQTDLTSLEAWCNTWKLRLNQSKSTHLRLSLSNRTNSPHNCHYNIAGAQLQSVRSQRDLGVVISDTLSWQQHYTKLCQKAYNALHLIKRTLSASASVNLKKQLYISLDLHDLLFLVKCLQDPDDNIEINRFITFRRTCTRAGSTGRMLTINLVHTSAARHFYFNRIAMLWNVVQSSTNLSVTESLFTVKRRLITFLWAHFNSRFDPLNSCTYHIVCLCSNCHSAVRF